MKVKVYEPGSTFARDNGCLCNAHQAGLPVGISHPGGSLHRSKWIVNEYCPQHGRAAWDAWAELERLKDEVQEQFGPLPTRAEAAGPHLNLASLGPGDMVRVRDDDGYEANYRVKYAPWKLGNGDWVIGLFGITGGYLLSRVVQVLSRATRAEAAGEATCPPGKGDAPAR